VGRSPLWGPPCIRVDHAEADHSDQTSAPMTWPTSSTHTSKSIYQYCLAGPAICRLTICKTQHAVKYP